MVRLAKSLVVLRDEINKAVPNRSKVSDGWIGDAAHRSRPSRHNPNNAGVVCALDITHDPANGMDVHALARWLVKGPHPDLDYIISNGQVASRASGWQWREYDGSNPHTKHAHFAVGRGPDSEPRPPYDTTAPWGVVAREPSPSPQKDEDMFPLIAALYEDWNRNVLKEDFNTGLLWWLQHGHVVGEVQLASDLAGALAHAAGF